MQWHTCRQNNLCFCLDWAIKIEVRQYTPKYILFQNCKYKSTKNGWFTFKKGMGSPISTVWKSTVISGDKYVRSVRSFKKRLNSLTPLLCWMLHVPDKSISWVSFVCFVVIILIWSELRILHIVEVDSKSLPLNNFFPMILLINVDFPELVSPESDFFFQIGVGTVGHEIISVWVLDFV